MLISKVSIIASFTVIFEVQVRLLRLGTAFHVRVQSLLCRGTILAIKELGTILALKIGMGLQVGYQGASSIKWFVAKFAFEVDFMTVWLISSMLSQILKSMKTKTNSEMIEMFPISATALRREPQTPLTLILNFGRKSIN